MLYVYNLTSTSKTSTSKSRYLKLLNLHPFFRGDTGGVELKVHRELLEFNGDRILNFSLKGSVYFGVSTTSGLHNKKQNIVFLSLN